MAFHGAILRGPAGGPLHPLAGRKFFETEGGFVDAETIKLFQKQVAQEMEFIDDPDGATRIVTMSFQRAGLIPRQRKELPCSKKS